MSNSHKNFEQQSFSQWRPLRKLQRANRVVKYDFPHPGGRQDSTWTHIPNLTERNHRRLDDEQLAIFHNRPSLRLEGDGIVTLQDPGDHLLPWQRELLESRIRFHREPDRTGQTNIYFLSILPDAQAELYYDFSGLTLFDQLPKEIRLAIWKLALSFETGRNVIVERLGSMWALDMKEPFYAPERLDMMGNPINRFHSKTTSPAILQANSESRQLALKTYIQLFPNRSLCVNPVYFNPEIDKITIRYMDYLDGGWFLRSISQKQAETFNKIKSLALSRRGSRFPAQAQAQTHNRGLSWKTAPLGFMLKYFRGLNSLTLFTEAFQAPDSHKRFTEGCFGRVLQLRREAERETSDKLCFDTILLWLEAIKLEDPTFKIPSFNHQELYHIPNILH